LTLVTVTGADGAGATVTDERVAWPTGRLDWESATVLRDGKLGTTVLTQVPFLTRWVPQTVRDIHERKWLRRGRLVRADGHVDTGWALHEVVHFGGPG
jgi:hypothetical protein